MKLSSDFPDPVQYPSFIESLGFEKSFRFQEWRKLMGKNWRISVLISLVYVLVIFLIQSWMKRKPKFQLNKQLFLWNLGLALFAIAGFLRTFPELFYLITQQDGFYRSICSREHFSVAMGFWSFAGTISKAVELGDTLFIVLRKRPLIFLHWYHHISVMLYTFYTFEAYDPSHRWFIVMNFFVHSIMYSYYALRALGFRLTRGIAMFVTVLQLLQMVSGMAINIYALRLMMQGEECAREALNLQLALAMYSSYLVLFADFFYRAYIKKPKSE